MTKADRTQLFAADHGMTVGQVRHVIALVKRCGEMGVAYCNGDPHPKNPRHDDKNGNAKLWSADHDVALATLRDLVEPLGFEVEVNGIWPTLYKAERICPLP